MGDEKVYTRLHEIADRWCDRAEKAEAEVERLRSDLDEWKTVAKDQRARADHLDSVVDRLNRDLADAKGWLKQGDSDRAAEEAERRAKIDLYSSSFLNEDPNP